MIYKITLKNGETRLMEAKDEADVKRSMITRSKDGVPMSVYGVAILNMIESIEEVKE